MHQASGSRWKRQRKLSAHIFYSCVANEIDSHIITAFCSFSYYFLRFFAIFQSFFSCCANLYNSLLFFLPFCTPRRRGNERHFSKKVGKFTVFDSIFYRSFCFISGSICKWSAASLIVLISLIHSIIYVFELTHVRLYENICICLCFGYANYLWKYDCQLFAINTSRQQFLLFRRVLNFWQWPTGVLV